jgi:hypothetical protein
MERARAGGMGLILLGENCQNTFLTRVRILVNYFGLGCIKIQKGGERKLASLLDAVK